MEKDIRLSREQACELLNMRRSSFCNSVREGILPRHYKDRNTNEKYWLKSELEEYINGNREKI